MALFVPAMIIGGNPYKKNNTAVPHQHYKHWQHAL
jgi:hypothetical protein